MAQPFRARRLRAPRARAACSGLSLRSSEALHVLHVGREVGDLGVAFPDERLVEHGAVSQPDVGQHAAVEP
jgi:hypothetical protein